MQRRPRRKKAWKPEPWQVDPASLDPRAPQVLYWSSAGTIEAELALERAQQMVASGIAFVIDPVDIGEMPRGVIAIENRAPSEEVMPEEVSERGGAESEGVAFETEMFELFEMEALHVSNAAVPPPALPPAQVPPDYMEKLTKIGTEAWNEALDAYFNPALGAPNFKYDEDPTTPPFYINPEENWRVTMNLAKVPKFDDERDVHRFIRGISKHEIGHYDTIPYDGPTTARLLKAAKRVLKDDDQSAVALNIYGDLVIDDNLHNRDSNETRWLTQTAVDEIKKPQPVGGLAGNIPIKTDPSDTWKTLIGAYEGLWNHRFNFDRAIMKPEDVKRSDELAKIVRETKDDQGRWDVGVAKTAKLLKDILNKEYPPGGDGQGPIGPPGKPQKPGSGQGGRPQKPGSKPQKPGSGPGGGQPGKPVKPVPGKGGGRKGPDDVRTLLGNDPTEIKNKDIGKAPNPDSVGDFAKGVDFDDFGGPARLSGMIDKYAPDLREWYKGRARGLIQIKSTGKKGTGQLPIYPETWNLGDPVEELDIPASLQVSPMMIPGRTTRKWKTEKGPPTTVTKAPPDLLIALDSSGSMGWNPSAKGKDDKGPYDNALVAALSAADYSISKGGKVALVNFSDRPLFTDWTTDIDKIADAALKHQGGGTSFPVNDMENLIKKAAKDRSTMTLLVTDMGINNFDQFTSSFTKLADEGHKVSGFFIGATPEEYEKDPRITALKSKGIKLHPVKDPKDLTGMVIEDFQDVYGGESGL
jgi:hypothetical protein